MPTVRTDAVTISPDLARSYREGTALLADLNEKRRTALATAKEQQVSSSEASGAWKNLHEIERRQGEVAAQVKRDADAILAAVAPSPL